MEGTESSCALSDAAARGTAWGESLMCIDTSLSVIFFKISNKSKRKIRSIVDYWLSILPIFYYDHLAEIKYLVFDGSFIWKRKTGAVILLDTEENKLIRGEYAFKENSSSALLGLFNQLKSDGLSPEAAL